MDVVDINKNFYIIWLGQLFGRLMVRDPSPYFYKGVSVPCPPYKRNESYKLKKNSISNETERCNMTSFCILDKNYVYEFFDKKIKFDFR